MTIDTTRRGLVIGLAATAAGAGLAMAGCASTPSAGDGAAPKARPHSYTETLHSVLVSEDGAHLVAIGARHHYVMEAPALLVRALRTPAPVHEHLLAVFTPFHVDREGRLTGEVTLQVAADAPAAAREAAAAIGLQRDPDGRWSATMALRGQRYAGWTYQVGGLTKDKLARAYTIEVTTDENVAGRIADEAATPIRVAADGVQLLYVAPLAPVIIGVIFLLKARD